MRFIYKKIKDVAINILHLLYAAKLISFVNFSSFDSIDSGSSFCRFEFKKQRSKSHLYLFEQLENDTENHVQFDLINTNDNKIESNLASTRKKINLTTVSSQFITERKYKNKRGVSSNLQEVFGFGVLPTLKDSLIGKTTYQIEYSKPHEEEKPFIDFEYDYLPHISLNFPANSYLFLFIIFIYII